MAFDVFEEKSGTARKSRWLLVVGRRRRVFGLWSLVVSAQPRIVATDGHAPAALKRLPGTFGRRPTTESRRRAFRRPRVAAAKPRFGDAVGDLGDFENRIHRSLDALQFACALQRRDPVSKVRVGQVLLR